MRAPEGRSVRRRGRGALQAPSPCLSCARRTALSPWTACCRTWALWRAAANKPTASPACAGRAAAQPSSRTGGFLKKRMTTIYVDSRKLGRLTWESRCTCRVTPGSLSTKSAWSFQGDTGQSCIGHRIDGGQSCCQRRIDEGNPVASAGLMRAILCPTQD